MGCGVWGKKLRVTSCGLWVKKRGVNQNPSLQSETFVFKLQGNLYLCVKFISYDQERKVQVLN